MKQTRKTKSKRYLILLCLLAAATFAVCAAGCITSDTSADLDEQLKTTPVSYAEVNGATLAYREFGNPENEPLVLIIGYTGIMDDWSGEFVYSLAEEYHVYTYDHRGMGYSVDNGEGYALSQLADDCAALMKTLGYEKFHVAGHSMGSMITQILLVTYPENIDKAVLISTLPYSQYPGAALTPDLIEAAVTKENELHGILREGIALQGYTGVFDELKYIENDVLIIVGTADTVTPQAAALEIAGEIDGSWLIRIKDSAHFIWLEAPKRVADSMLLFLGTEQTYTP